MWGSPYIWWGQPQLLKETPSSAFLLGLLQLKAAGTSFNGDLQPSLELRSVCWE